MDHNPELEDRKIKQKYLREHIIQENLDPDEFSTFLAERREEGPFKKPQHRLLDNRRNHSNSPRFY